MDVYLEYLDELRESGEINMFGAGSYLQDEFDLSKTESSEILMYWIRTYEDRHP